ncbi:MAG TPA: peptidyl-prolyl cis-trans isomerase [Terriglobia bacterium]|nr:peptidyl-prolyl cis-trans isomerase [Terriglobia bacterium]
MFRLFDKHHAAIYKWVMAFFLAIVSIGMILVFTPLGGGGDTTLSSSDVLASVGGTKITMQELRQTIDNRLRNSSLGSDPHIIPAIAGTMLDDMVLRQAMVMQARKMGLEVSGQELMAALEKFPWLYPNGKFVGITQYQNFVRQEMGVTTQEFEDQIRQSLLLQKIQAVVSDGVSVTPAEVHEAYNERYLKTKIQYVVFDPSKFLKSVPITDNALQDYFKKNASHYEKKEQRQVQYVLITPDEVRANVTVTDSEMKQYYTSHLSDYRVPDRVKVEHILFKTTGKSPDEVKQLEKTAADVLAKIKAGSNFEDMAKKYSQDTSASNGGNIGWITHGQTVKEFEDTAFNMSPGQVSGLVHTTYGIHIIKVLDKQTAHLQSFEDVKDAIHDTLMKQAMAAAQQDYADKLENKLKADPKQFDSIAQQSGLQVKQTPLFQYNQTVPDFGSNDAFQNLSFELQLNEVGQPITVPKGTAIIQVKQIVPAHIPKLDDVRPMVTEDYRAAQSKVIAHQKAEAFSADAQKGDFAKLAKAGGYNLQESKDFTQQDTVPNLGPGQGVPQAFTLPPGDTSEVLSVEGNDVVIHVVSHTPPDQSNFASQEAQIREDLLTQKRSLAYEIYRQNLKKQLIASGQLKLNEQGMKTFLASYETQ